jgi:hypothetical protein
MKKPTNTDTATRAGSLQTNLVCCKLKTVCKLESFKNNNLCRFVVCRVKFAETPCKLTQNPVTTRVSERFLVCTQTPIYLWYMNPLTFLTSVSGFPRRASHLTGWDGSLRLDGGRVN